MSILSFQDYTRQARNASPEKAQQQVDELMANEHKLSEPFTKDELAAIFRKNKNPADKRFIAEILDSEIQENVLDIQSKMDSFIRYYRDFQSPFSKEELRELFQKHSWGQAHGWRDYLLLTDEEKKIVDELGLTPKQKDFTPSPRSLEEQRSDLKQAAGVKPESGPGMKFTLTTFCVLWYDSTDGKSYYCAGDCTVYQKGWRENQIEADEYYLNRIKEELKESDDQVAAMWMHILSSRHFAVEKNELRPDQIEYFEEEVRKTLKICKTVKLAIDDWNSPEETYLKEQCELWKKFQLLTETEKQILEELNLTPEYPSPSAEKQNPDELSAEEQRSELKKQFSDWIPIQVNLGRESHFYYVYHSTTTRITGLPESPIMVIEKAKLRSDQIEFMERKCREPAELNKRESGFLCSTSGTPKKAFF